jgi:hypothetical protein
VTADDARPDDQALEAAVARVAGLRGGPDARRVVAAADPRPESPGETRSRIAIARPGLPAPGDAVFAEKRREDALRDSDRQVVRWCWDELSPFDDVAARLRRAFDRS